MKAWKRITVVVFVLIGSTAAFGYWSFNQFDQIFDSLNTSPENTTTLTTATNLEPSFIFPQKGDGVYMGCTYKVSWQSPVVADSFEIALFDAGMEKAVESIYSGLVKENSIGTSSSDLDWKVGVVWPGEYYIVVSKINGTDTEIKSDVFIINRVPESVDKEKMTATCLESKGRL